MTLESRSREALDVLAAEALACDEPQRAFRLADRYCRTERPEAAYIFLVRAEAHYRLGRRHAAIKDILRALEIEPENIVANRRLFAWGEGRQRHEAARTLVRVDQDPNLLHAAIECLRDDGERAFGAVSTLEDVVKGWAVWSSDSPLEVLISTENESASTLVDADPRHPLNDLGRARSFALPLPRMSGLQEIAVRTNGLMICRTLAPGRMSAHRHPIVGPARSQAGAITIIVPIYRDYAATQACLESLMDALEDESDFRVILVDDGVEDAELRQLLETTSERPNVSLVRNQRNLGFVASINTVLREAAAGDVLLLNSDTVAPRGFVRRLAETARSSADIGIVMPLSNNGDLAGFPIPYEATPLPPREVVDQIDLIAAEVNAGQVVEIPNGVGFCLYIKRECLDSVGALSEDFGRGYLEDVDFCLRARAQGFRCVCAPSIFVGHAGSKSFGSEKRALVIRNGKIIRSRFPKYHVEYAAFAETDPLDAFRRPIHLRLSSGKARPHILVTGQGVVRATAEQCAHGLLADGKSAILIETNLRGTQIEVLNPNGRCFSRQLRFDLSSLEDRDAVVQFLKGQAPARIHFFDPLKTPFELVDLLLELKAPYEMVIADAGLLGSAGAARLLAVNDELKEDRSVHRIEDEHWQERWRKIAKRADKILMADCFGNDAAKPLPYNFFQERGFSQERGAPNSLRAAKTFGGKFNAPRLAFLPIRPSADEHRITSAIIQELASAGLELNFIVIGATLDDDALMRHESVHVTGPIHESELEPVVNQYGVDFLFVNVSQPLYGHPLFAAGLNCSRPTAYFDWSEGATPARKGDLAIALNSPLSKIVDSLLAWIGPGCEDTR